MIIKMCVVSASNERYTSKTIDVDTAAYNRATADCVTHMLKC